MNKARQKRLRTLLALAVALVFGLPSAALALTSTVNLVPFTGDDINVVVTLDDLGGFGDIKFTIETVAPPSIGDLVAFYFNISDDSLLPGLSVINADFPVTDTDFSGDVTSVGGNYANMSGGDPNPGSFDAGVAIGSNGAPPGDFFPMVMFTLTHDSVALSLALFDGENMGARILSVGPGPGPGDGSSKVAIPEPLTATLAVMAVFAIGMKLRRRVYV